MKDDIHSVRKRRRRYIKNGLCFMMFFAFVVCLPIGWNKADSISVMKLNTGTDRYSIDTVDSHVKTIQYSQYLQDKIQSENKMALWSAIERENQKVIEARQEKEKQEEAVQTMGLPTNQYSVLTRIVEAEAGGEDIKGRILVANVILNRVEDTSFPDTIYDVVFAKNGTTYQFSPVYDGNYYRVSVSNETIEAVTRALQGEDYSQGALYFSSRSQADPSNMQWFDKNLIKLFKHGNHEFFK